MSNSLRCTAVVSVSMLMFSNLYAGENTGLAGRTEIAVDKKVIDVQDMLSVTDLGGMTEDGLGVSPNGRYVAFQMHQADLEEDDYTVGWYVLDLTDTAKSPVHVGDAGDPLLFRARDGTRVNGAWQSTDPVWSPDSQWVAYRRMDGESVQVWRSRVDSGIQEQLTKSEGYVDAFYWSDDGQEIWFETDAAPQKQVEYLKSKWENGLWAGNENLQPRSTSYWMSPYEVTFGQPALRVLHLRSRQTRPASESEIERHFGSNAVSLHPVFRSADRLVRVPGRPFSRNATISYDGVNLAWLESQDKAVQRSTQIHARLGRTDQPDISCELNECFGPIGGLWWSRDGSEVLFTRWEEGSDTGRTVIHGWHVEDNTMRRIYSEVSRHLSACSSTGHSLICFSDEPSGPRSLVEVKFADGSVEELFDPNPQFKEILVGEVERIEWGSELGTTAFGWIVRPIGYEAGKRYPLVINQYRAKDCFKGGTGAEYPSHLFAAQGFVILCFDHPSPAENYVDQDYPYFSHKRMSASYLEPAIDFLDREGLIDPTTVGITGLSGGVDTISYALSHPNRISAVIVTSLGWAPINYYFGSPTGRERSRKGGFGRPGTADDKFWSGMSPGMNPGTVRAPVLIQASDDEAHNAMFNYVTLQEEGKPIDMYVFKDEYHIKWHPRNRKAVAVRSVDWMRFWLKGEEDADPAKAEQYERWRRMREEQEKSEPTAKMRTTPLPVAESKIAH